MRVPAGPELILFEKITVSRTCLFSGFNTGIGTVLEFRLRNLNAITNGFVFLSNRTIRASRL